MGMLGGMNVSFYRVCVCVWDSVVEISMCWDVCVVDG